MKRPASITASVLAAAVALSLGTAWAQGSAGTGSTGTGTGAGSSTGGSPTSPMAQPGSGTRNQPQQGGSVARADRKFIEEAAASGLYEVQAAQLAATKATDQAVKDYARQLADHHSTANQELTQLANAKGIELPPGPTRSMRRDIEQLGKKTGAEFDRDFVRNVGIKEHEKDIKRFQNASRDVKDPQLKAWIDKTLPALEQHLAQAQRLPQAGSDSAQSGKGSRSGQGTGSMGSSGSGASGGSSGSSGNRTGN